LADRSSLKEITVSEIDALKAEIKKLSSKATQAKMDLHDLSEELPKDWERIPEVAQSAFESHQVLIQARLRLAALQPA
jgi:hypothetical protein